MAALEMVKDKATKTPFEGHLNMGDRIANMSIDNGLICRPLGPAIVLCPQFIITKNQIDEMFNSLQSTLKHLFVVLKPQMYLGYCPQLSFHSLWMLPVSIQIFH